MDGMEKKSAEDVAKWMLGLVFSAGLATLQNWRNKREQQKVFRAQVQEMHEVVTAKPAAAPQEAESHDAHAPAPPPGDDLRTLVQRIQSQLAEHQSRTDERHEANLARFESIEHAQEQMGEGLSDIRQYLRENRGETRTMLKRILTKVSESAATPKESDAK